MNRDPKFSLLDFGRIFSPLAVQLRFTDADETATRAYYVALNDLEIAFVAMAAERFAREAEWFPKTSEWRVMAGRIEAERIDQQRATLRKLPTPLCARCDDSGWVAEPAARATRLLVRPDAAGKPSIVAVENDAPRRRCACQTLRRQEVLGVRPMPALPPAPGVDADGPLTVGQSATAIAALKRRGLALVLRAMPKASAVMNADVDHESQEG